nr:uncharacterized protein LOC125979850 [Syngnathus scovelli]
MRLFISTAEEIAAGELAHAARHQREAGNSSKPSGSALYKHRGGDRGASFDFQRPASSRTPPGTNGRPEIAPSRADRHFISTAEVIAAPHWTSSGRRAHAPARHIQEAVRTRQVAENSPRRADRLFISTAEEIAAPHWTSSGRRARAPARHIREAVRTRQVAENSPRRADRLFISTAEEIAAPHWTSSGRRARAPARHIREAVRTRQVAENSPRRADQL